MHKGRRNGVDLEIDPEVEQKLDAYFESNGIDSDVAFRRLLHWFSQASPDLQQRVLGQSFDEPPILRMQILREISEKPKIPTGIRLAE